MKPTAKGFTLIELLVVIAILGVLATIAYVAYNNVTKSARDSKRKADVTAIHKAYEVKYTKTGRYVPLLASDYQSGLPKDPNASKGDYFNVVALDGSGYKVCASLEDNTANQCNVSTPNCFCKISHQEAITNTSQSNLTGVGVPLGWGYSADDPACDTGGSLKTGLVGHWKLDETSWDLSCSATNSILDSTTSVRHAKSCPANAGPVQTPASKSGKAASFDGSNDEITLSSSIPANFSPRFTISAWIKTSISDSVVRDITGGSGCGWSNFAVKNGKLYYQYTNNPPNQEIFGTTTVSDNNWHLATFVFNTNTDIRMYVDGAFDNNTPASSSISPMANLLGTIGGLAGCNYNFNGTIDDVRIYNRALTAGEVTTLYNYGIGCFP